MARLVRKNLMVDPDALRELAEQWGTSESAAVREAVTFALAAQQMAAALQGLHELGAFADAEQLFGPWPDEASETRLRAPQVFGAIMQILRDRYAVLVRDVASGQPHILINLFRGHDTDVAADHLLVAWLRGYDGFGRDGLFGSLMVTAPESVREHVVHKLRATLHAAHKDADADAAWRERVLAELEAFWAERVSAVDVALAPGQPSRELTAFAYWLPELRPRLEELEPRLTAMCRRLQWGRGFEDIVDYLLEHAAGQPAAAARVLRVLIDRYLGAQELIWYAHKLPDLVAQVWTATEDGHIRGLIGSVVSDLLERRGVDLRPQIG